MSDYQTAQPTSRGGVKLKYIMMLLLVAFAGGGVATWWLANSYGVLAPAAQNASEEESPAAAPLPVGNVAPAPAAVAGPPTQVEGQVVPVYVTDPALSGDAVRGEGLLLTFAARRTLDNGAPLGYLSEQLRLRFGATQPQAVATVIAAAQAPVTISNLQTELTGLTPVLLTGNRDTSVWATFERELSQLFVLHRDGGAALTPQQRMFRAQVFVEAGNISAAISEVSAMPGASAAQSWLVRAKRYVDARKGLDRLEQMALIRPIVVPVKVPPPVEQPTPETVTDTP